MQNARAIAVVLATVALVAAGCGRADTTNQPESETTVGSGPVQGTVTMWAMGAEGEALPELVKDFEAQNPGVKVEITAVPWDAAHNKFQTAIAAGTTPDMAMIGTTWMPDFADALATVPADIDSSGFFPSSVASNKIGDRVVGVPWYADTRVLYYRTDLAEKAGWTSPPKNWAELKTMAKDLQTKAGADWGFAMPAGSFDSYQASLWIPWSNGAELTAGDKWTLDTPEMVEAFGYQQEFFTEKISDPNVDPATGAREAAFVDGRTPMLVEGPALAGQLAEIGGADFTSKYATAVVPTGKSSTSFAGGSNLSVFADAENPDASWRLISYLSQPEVQAKWYQLTGDLPAAQAAWELPELSGNDKLTAFGDQLQSAKVPPATATWVQVAAAGDAALEKMARGEQDAATALKELQAQADSIGMG
ncbi:extracellular solute-binding protein [Naumannella cuiyingiana]|uniref:Multiple sugar transport system substrate-binding protein n=1 Tax=Naumannella cuiyingiana TaxID=1347891 RepID=A0A7Z0DA48_9ACTN|nr:extracellular solute-binding protein [Naumannella cuiyingiana]NYI71774.1 multiple sugar transport system substrate-binding protein [Naumannella cuiyingiana]